MVAARDDSGIDAQLGGWAATKVLTTGSSKTLKFSSPQYKQASMHTVQISVGDAPNFFATATVTWYVGGMAITRTFDVLDGVSISGNASHVEVTVQDNTPSSISSGEDYEVTVTDSPFPRTGSVGTGPTTTLQNPSTGVGPFALAEGASISYALPRGTGISAVSILSDAPGSTILAQLFAGSTLLLSTTSTILPYVTGADLLQLTNLGTSTQNVLPILAIDG